MGRLDMSGAVTLMSKSVHSSILTALLALGCGCDERHTVDASTLGPVRGATISLSGGTATSGPDGWYRIDLGCPERSLPGGTTFIYVTHPNYVQRQQVVGRGVQGVLRLDFDLERR